MAVQDAVYEAFAQDEMDELGSSSRTSWTSLAGELDEFDELDSCTTIDSSLGSLNVLGSSEPFECSLGDEDSPDRQIVPCQGRFRVRDFGAIFLPKIIVTSAIRHKGAWSQLICDVDGAFES